MRHSLPNVFREMFSESISTMGYQQVKILYGLISLCSFQVNRRHLEVSKTVTCKANLKREDIIHNIFKTPLTMSFCLSVFWGCVKHVLKNFTKDPVRNFQDLSSTIQPEQTKMDNHSHLWFARQLLYFNVTKSHVAISSFLSPPSAELLKRQ